MISFTQVPWVGLTSAIQASVSVERRHGLLSALLCLRPLEATKRAKRE